MDVWICPQCRSEFVYALENDDLETIGGSCLECGHQWMFSSPTECQCDQCDSLQPLMSGVSFQTQDYRGFWVTVRWICAACAEHPKALDLEGVRVVPTRELADVS